MYLQVTPVLVYKATKYWFHQLIKNIYNRENYIRLKHVPFMLIWYRRGFFNLVVKRADCCLHQHCYQFFCLLIVVFFSSSSWLLIHLLLIVACWYTLPFQQLAAITAVAIEPSTSTDSFLFPWSCCPSYCWLLFGAIVHHSHWGCSQQYCYCSLKLLLIIFLLFPHICCLSCYWLLLYTNSTLFAVSFSNVVNCC